MKWLEVTVPFGLLGNAWWTGGGVLVAAGGIDCPYVVMYGDVYCSYLPCIYILIDSFLCYDLFPSSSN